ncbi:small integral membrane protein 14 isoform X1 [Manacus candei]|uniref:small integral membrane protein 14 isoform X1 n=2 Tax=Manacus candei TaxID=415023 RepID=UPI002226E14A|nr:small integral membrane protein 14 isoform X1 [Manacus candei]
MRGGAAATPQEGPRERGRSGTGAVVGPGPGPGGAGEAAALSATSSPLPPRGRVRCPPGDAQGSALLAARPRDACPQTRSRRSPRHGPGGPRREREEEPPRVKPAGTAGPGPQRRPLCCHGSRPALSPHQVPMSGCVARCESALSWVEQAVWLARLRRIPLLGSPLPYKGLTVLSLP